MGWQDVGDYKCVAKNDLGKAVKNIRIEVAGERSTPPVLDLPAP